MLVARWVERSSSREWMIEDIAGERLAPRRAPEQQRQLPIGAGVPGQIVVDDQHVAALLHEVLGNGGGRVGRDVAQARRVVALGDHDDGVVHGPVPRRSAITLATAEARWPRAQ